MDKPHSRCFLTLEQTSVLPGLTLYTPWENTWIIWQTPQSHQDQSMTPSSNQQERFQMSHLSSTVDAPRKMFTSTAPTEWCAPIVVTPKKNSDRIHMCVDLSKLNKFI